METRISEIADGIYRLSTYVPDIAPPAGFTFNQFLVLGDEPLMFHTGLRKMFPLNRDALSRIIPPERLRWIAFGHFEADECGAMNEWLSIAPQAQAAHGQTGCMVSLNDFADRAPRILADGEVIDLGGGKRVRFIDTPHTPHGWDAGVLYEESTRTLLCGDLFTQLGDGPALTDRRRGRAGDRGGGSVPVFRSQPRHGRNHSRPCEALAAHARPDARSVISRATARRRCARSRTITTAASPIAGARKTNARPPDGSSGFDRDRRRPRFGATDDPRKRIAGGDDLLQHRGCDIGCHRDQQSAGSLRIGEQMTLPVFVAGRQRHLVAVARPVAMRGAGDATVLGERGGFRQQRHDRRALIRKVSFEPRAISSP